MGTSYTSLTNKTNAKMNSKSYIVTATFITVLIVFGLVFHSASSGSSSNADQQLTFQEANQSYKEQRYADAVVTYKRLLSEGVHGAHIHHNLASSYEQQGDIGRSILYYTKAMQLDHYDDVIRDRLTNLREEHAIKNSRTSTWQKIVETFSSAHWVILASLIFLCLVTQVLLSFVSYIKLSLISQISTIAIVAGLIVLSIFAVRTQHDALKDKAIVVGKNVSLRVSPFQEAAELLAISPGEMVTIFSGKEHQGYTQVKLLSGQTGWLKYNELETIDMK